ncbi:hypothetical protein T440DRAFT_473680 [Plenodomus tracheiphilus IPT5]|uniref:Lytic polysaccharide monooxygenase n=1 Tax=Plenodomus tracheiphilus IPT5 TaxID=1408161 RepID=A0A6A7ALU6_9PLEO|nr:hypothetical protein T440DRAFT_473800 [Plenodomus tracheiphilus IPT5]KAF2844080.1 hypothetical protein T440DRAFT_473680 [Plenodomus tracheiphilus IPT5]
MHFSTLFLPLFLMGMAASSPIQATDGDNSIAKVDGTAAVVEPNALPVHEIPAFIADEDIAVPDLSAPATNSPSADEKSLDRRARVETGEFMIGRSYAQRTVTTMTVHGVSVIVTAWFNGIHTVFVQMAPAFPGAPKFVMAGFEDPEKRITTAVVRWAWDEVKSITAPGGHTYQFDDIFRFFWNS